MALGSGGDSGIMKQGNQRSMRYSAVEDRGRIYLHIFRELKKRYGEDDAVSVMNSASNAHGVEVGKSLQHLAPNNIAGMVEEYFKGPDGGATFNPEIEELSEDQLQVHVKTCPLKDGWLDYGCSDDEVCTLLKCATGFDKGVYETAGFDYDLEVWQPGREGCCRTRIRAKSKTS